MTFDDYIGHNGQFEDYIVEIKDEESQNIEKESFKMSKYALVFNERKRVNEYFISEESLRARLLKVCLPEIKQIYVENSRENFVKVDNFNEEFVYAKKGKCMVSNRFFSAKNLTYYDGVGLVSSKNVGRIKKCDVCGKYEIDGTLTHINSENKDVCRSCLASNYSKCCGCGEYHYRYNMITIGEKLLCGSCIESGIERGIYARCHNCGCVDTVENLTRNERTGRYYCDDCYESSSNVIQGYHHTTDLEFVKVSGETTKRYFGVELEIGGVKNSKSRMDVASLALEKIYHLECKTDSSIHDGFEMVTNPMTYKHLMSLEDKWSDLFEFASEKKFKSNEAVNCGMHIHISKDSFKNQASIDKVCQLFEAFWNNIFIFSRRSEDQLHWCNRYWSSSYSGKIKKKKLKEITDDADDRYMAVNLTNENTVEFRIFNGTLDIEEFYSNIQFINRICDVVNDLSDSEFDNLTWNELMNGNTEYSYLIDYASGKDFTDVDKLLGDNFESDTNDKKSQKYVGVINNSDLSEYSDELHDSEEVRLALPIGTRVRITDLNGSTRSTGGVRITYGMVGNSGQWFTIDRVYNTSEENVFKVHYILDNGDGLTYTIDMFDNFQLPVDYLVDSTFNLNNMRYVPYGTTSEMIFDTGERIKTSEFDVPRDLPKYRFENNCNVYNNFMFKDLALLNLAIDNGTSYDSLSWL